jgi:diguanylate cyclase (GGDEF)-like protein
MKPYVVIALGLMGAAVFKYADFILHRTAGTPLYSLMPLCLFPIFFISRYASKNLTVWAAVFMALGWVAVGSGADLPPLEVIVVRASGFAYGTVFVLLAAFFADVVQAYYGAKETAWKDDLTKAFNSKYFFERASTEMARAERYQRPLTIALIAIQGFAEFKKRMGTATGNNLLALTADTFIERLRSADFVGRVGDDAFGVVLPETGYPQAQIVLPRLQQLFLAAMAKNGWSPTFLACAMVLTKPPRFIDEVIGALQAEIDNLKKQGKGEIVYKEMGKSD